ITRWITLRRRVFLCKNGCAKTNNNCEGQNNSIHFKTLSINPQITQIKNRICVICGSEVQSYLSINATITSAGATAATSTKGTEQSSHIQRLTETGRGKITHRRAKINVIQDVLKIEGDVESVPLLTRSPTAATTLWTTGPR